jgi:hypothetical protein
MQREIEKFTKDLKNRFKWSSNYSSYQFVKENTRPSYESTSPRKSVGSSVAAKPLRRDSQQQAAGSTEASLSPRAVMAYDSSDDEATGCSPTSKTAPEKGGTSGVYQIRV